MNGLPCRYYDGRTSTPREAEMTITADGNLIVAIDGIENREVHSLADVRIPHRMADTPRHVRLPGGASCEVRDNHALDAMQVRTESGRQPVGRRFERLLHRLDSTWRGAAAALAVTAAILLSFTKWGTPAVARLVVAATPPELEAVIGENLMTLFLQLDVLTPTEVDEGRQAEILRAFYEMKDDTGVEAAVLGFFSSARFGPNAFALPGGTVVITDELVELADNDEEIIAVLAHELGHVAGRHVLRRIAERSSMLVLWTAFTGDVSVAALSVLGPDQLLDQRYSRVAEREADRFAFEYLLGADISPTRLGELLRRLEGAHGAGGVPNWLASHPGADERARNAAEAAERAGGAEAIE